MKDINEVAPEWQENARGVCGAFRVMGSMRACPVSAVLDHFPGAAVKSFWRWECCFYFYWVTARGYCWHFSALTYGFAHACCINITIGGWRTHTSPIERQSYVRICSLVVQNSAPSFGSADDVMFNQQSEDGWKVFLASDTILLLCSAYILLKSLLVLLIKWNEIWEWGSAARRPVVQVNLCSSDILQLPPQTALYFALLLIKQLFFFSLRQWQKSNHLKKEYLSLVLCTS